MICPKCHAEYLDHLKRCGDCNTDLIEASNVDLPTTEMNWLLYPLLKAKYMRI